MVAVNQREITSAPVAVNAPAVVPPRQAVLGSGAATNVHPPAALQSRAVVAKTAPPPAPIPFNARQAAIEKNQGRPLSMSQAQQIQASQNHVNAAQIRMAPPAKTINPPINNNRVNSGMGQPGPLNTNRPPNGNASTNANPSMNQPNHPSNVNATQPPNNSRVYADRPPAAHSNTAVNPQLEQKHQQQIQQLQQKQDQQYEKLQQKQVQEEQRNRNQQNQQQLEQKHQQQMQQLQEKQQQQQQSLQQKQQTEHQKAYKEPTNNNSKQSQSHEDKDKPHH
jgi:hypothetical protein